MKAYIARDQQGTLVIYKTRPYKNEDFGVWHGAVLFPAKLIIKRESKAIKAISWEDTAAKEIELTATFKLIKQ